MEELSRGGQVGSDQNSALISANQNLQEDINAALEARDEAQKQVLLCRQLSIIYQHREQNVD